MAASTTDLFMKVGVPNTATTLSAPGYTAGQTTPITVGSTAGWSTDTQITFALDRVQTITTNGVTSVQRIAGTYCEFVGIVTSSTAISNVVLKYGNSQDYISGSTTRVIIPITSTRENALIDGLSVAHNLDGSLKSSIITTSKLADSSVTTAKIADGSITNQKLVSTIGGSWQTWTPTWTNVTVGNGVVQAYYVQIGKTTHATLSFSFGTTSSITGQVIFSLPAQAATRYTGSGTGMPFVGLSYIEKFNTSTYDGRFRIQSLTTASLMYNTAGNTNQPTGVVTATGTTPMTWANNDFFTGTFTYEAA